MSGKQVTIKGPDGAFMAYVNGAGPAIVVIQEIFGINHVVRKIVDDLAAQGWTAIAPDLFWRLEPGVELTDRTKEEWDRAFDLMNRFDIDKGVEDIAATIGYARTLSANGKVGAVGYCLGGLLAYLTAARTDADATAGYYGVNIPNFLGEKDGIKNPLTLHVAGQDQFVDSEAQKAMKEGLKDHPKVTLHFYPERDHAFARAGGAHYHEGDAQTANARTRDFFRDHLG
jgi:carboxymethylenebutenolidase